MSSNKKHIVVVVGETSGDMHASHLIDALKEKDANITFSGLGGPRMEESGMELYQDFTKLAVVGFVEVLKNYDRIKEAFDLILKKIEETKADAVLLVDYPGFNLRLAKKLYKKTKVIYYISPQVWAWKKNRVHAIKKYVDRMLVIFEFEKTFYKKYNMDVAFVGHPLMDSAKPKQSKEDFLKASPLDPFKTTIGLLPGSREKEVERHLPVMIQAAQRLHKQFAMMQFLIIKAPSLPNKAIESYTKDLKIPFDITTQHVDGINACDICMVASGTATLETAILGKPMVVIYKTSFLTWLIAKWVVRIQNIGLVNVVAQKRVVPECIQFDATGKKIAEEIKTIFTDDQRTAKIKEDLLAVKKSLGSGGASDHAADEILKVLH